MYVWERKDQTLGELENMNSEEKLQEERAIGLGDILDVDINSRVKVIGEVIPTGVRTTTAQGTSRAPRISYNHITAVSPP